MTPYCDINLGPELGYGLVPEDTTPLPEPMLILCIHLRTNSQEVFMNLIDNKCSEITIFKLLSHIP